MMTFEEIETKSKREVAEDLRLKLEMEAEINAAINRYQDTTGNTVEYITLDPAITRIRIGRS